MKVRSTSIAAFGYRARTLRRNVTYVLWNVAPDTPWLVSLVPMLTTTASAW